MRRHVILAFAALSLIGVAGGVQAQETIKEAKDAAVAGDFSKRLFAGDAGKAKSYACFVRTYDGAHMAQHRLQKVTAMKLLVTAETDPEDNVRTHSIRLGIKFRNRPGDFDSSGSCGHAAISEDANDKPHLGCSIDCDGGGITIEMGKDDSSTLVRLDRVKIWKNNKPEEERLELNGGADDRVFRLDRVGLEMCRPLVQDRAELAAMRTRK